MLRAAWFQLHQRQPEGQESPVRSRDFTAGRVAGLEASRGECEHYLVNNVVERLFQDPYDFDVSLEPGSDSAKGKVALMDAVIGRMKEIAASHAIPLMLLFIPSKLDASELDGIVAPDGNAYPDYRRRNLSGLAAVGAARRGIAYIDLFDDFWRDKKE